jgi:hypothetical protein
MACMCIRIVSLSAAWSMKAACSIEVQATTRKTVSGSVSRSPILGAASQQFGKERGASGRRRAHKLGTADLDQRLVHGARNVEPPPLRCDHRVDHPCPDFVERASSQRLAIRFNGSRRLHEITLEHNADERLPVGKILIERADRHPRPFSDPSRRQLAVADGQQNLNARFVDRIHRRFGARLNRLFSRA